MMILTVTEDQKQYSVEKQIREHQPRIRSFIRKRVPSMEDAEDLAQDVFYRFVQSMDATHNPIENISGWLFRVARNLISNKSRKKKESSLPMDAEVEEQGDRYAAILPVADDADSPVNIYIRSQMWKELEKALDELPEAQKEVFELTELEGLSVKDVSVLTGAPVNTLLSRKHYAVKFLRKRLRTTYEELIHQ